ncbi:MAG: DUF4139 domain-containing protein [Burkholderiales bacterium]|nr:DUF4139 domain-containing protein [Burkholderiales bacterium]
MKKLRPLALALVAALPAAALAGSAVTIYSSAQPGTIDPQVFKSGGEGSLVPGYALIREEREFALKPGRNLLRVNDVPAFIDPTTVAFTSLTDPRGTRVVEQNFEFDLTSSAKLLSRYLDREITVELTRGNTAEAVTGTLVGTQGGLTLRLADGSVRILPSYASIRLPGLPGGLISKPTLVWDIDAAQPGTHKSRFTYQTRGMTWWTDYNLTYSEPRPGSCKVDVAAWVTIVNQSGASFADAKLKLIAGDVQRAQPRGQVYPQALAAAKRMESKDDAFAEKAFFEYHLYTLGRPASIANNSTKQIELFPTAPGVGCEKTLVYQGQAGMYPYGYYSSPLMDRSFGVQSNRKVDVYLRLKNSKANGLGVPLPAGKIRVSKLDDADGALEFIGEDLIDHTPRDETVQVKLGSAFDVVGERRQVDFRIDTSAKWIEEDIEIKLRNQKPDETVTVLAKENLYRWSNWAITKRSQEFRKDDSRTILFPVRLAPKGEATVRYTVRYTW